MLPENPNKKLKFNEDNLREIYLAGGCFWGVDAYLARVPGVYRTESGYANGHKEPPVTYREVCTGKTGYAEAVYILYDHTKITLEALLDEFFEIIDPTVLNRQANDIGTQYRTGIYFVAPEDKEIIDRVMIRQQEKYSLPIVTEVQKIDNYCPAEEYHQDYLEKNPGGYCHITF